MPLFNPFDPAFIKLPGLRLPGHPRINIPFPGIPSGSDYPTTPGTIPPAPPTVQTPLPGGTTPTPAEQIPTTPVPPSQFPAGTGDTRMQRLYNMLRDPRTSGALIAMAQRLSQPRGPGRTGVTNAIDALSAGYNAINAATLLQQERDRLYREEVRKSRESDQQIEESKARVESTKAGTERIKAETGQMGRIQKRADEALNLERIRTEASIEQGWTRLATDTEKAANEAAAERKRLEEMERQRFSREREGRLDRELRRQIADQELRVREKEANARVSASRADLARAMKDVDPKNPMTIAKLHATAMQHYMESTAITEATTPVEERTKKAIAYANQAVDANLKKGGVPIPNPEPSSVSGTDSNKGLEDDTTQKKVRRIVERYR